MPGINMQIFLKSEYDDTPLTLINTLTNVSLYCWHCICDWNYNQQTHGCVASLPAVNAHKQLNQLHAKHRLLFTHSSLHLCLFEHEFHANALNLDQGI